MADDHRKALEMLEQMLAARLQTAPQPPTGQPVAVPASTTGDLVGMYL